jgi:hypothetical protein
MDYFAPVVARRFERGCLPPGRNALTLLTDVYFHVMRLLTLILLGTACAALTWAAELAVGTWKLNPAKSKLLGSRAVKELTVVITEQNGEFEVTDKGARNDGTAISRRYTMPVNGGPVRFLEGDLPTGGSMEMKRISKDKADFVTSVNGKEVQVQHDVVSADGKTLTVTTAVITTQGQPFEVVEVLDKQ